MQKTRNYNLNKPDPTDPIRIADLNANADAIDTALGEKDAQIAALQTALAAAGNCTVVTGTYTGTGTYNSTSNTLTFSKTPIALFISGYNYTAVILRSGGFSVGTNSSVNSIYPTWKTDGTVSWRSGSNEYFQMNISGITYTYFALLM